ncbi:MAG TPA: ABC transporter substrate-binding protein [Anaeromyxobacteraceae bacterium]|nr:ABC transporter substrate-binding protein [Anaeromyxobacteraceae bacterium]
MKRLARIAAVIASLLPLAGEAAPKQKTIGIIVPTLDAQFWNSYVSFTKDAAQALGVKLIVLNANNKPDLLPKYIEDLVSKGVDGMIVVPYWASDKVALRNTKNAKIPLIFADTYSDVQPQDAKYPDYIAFIGPSDADAGYRMAKALIAAVEPDAGGKKVIAVVDGTPGTSVAIDRAKGLEKALSEHPEVVVAGRVSGNFVRDESQTAFAPVLHAHPEIKGVWAANGGTATGVMTAIMNAGKVPGKDVLVVGMDLNPENVEAVEEGKLLFDIGGHWLQGGFALVLMYDHLNGFKIPKARSNIKISLLPLTKDKVASFKSLYPKGIPSYDFKAHSKAYSGAGAPDPVIELSYTKVANR